MYHRFLFCLMPDGRVDLVVDSKSATIEYIGETVWSVLSQVRANADPATIAALDRVLTERFLARAGTVRRFVDLG